MSTTAQELAHAISDTHRIREASYDAPRQSERDSAELKTLVGVLETLSIKL
jgi:hypothetical protein